MQSVIVSPRLFNTTEAAKAAGVTRATVQEWIRRAIVAAPKLRIRNGRAVRLWTTAEVAKLKSVEVPMGRPKKRK
jgi:MerR HTH family regulatory protein